MLDQDTEPERHTEPVSVWPPPPITDALSAGQPVSAPADDIRAFQKQNVFLLLFLTVVTIGIYAYFWMLRTARTINRVTPERPLYLWGIWVGMIVAAGGLVFGLAVGLIEGLAAGTPPGVLTELHTAVKVLDRIDEIYFLFLAFLLRGGLSYVLSTRNNKAGDFGSVGTFFLSILYLQHRINVNIRECSRADAGK